MNPVVENGIEKLFQFDLNNVTNNEMIIKLINKMVAFQESNAIFH